MSETKQLRLGQVARKLNVGRNTIINFLHEKGYEVDSNPNTKISQDLFKILENAFEDSAVEKKVASNIKIGIEEKASFIQEIKKKEEEKKEEEKKEEEKKEEKAKDPEKKETGGIKIIKKIKLDDNSKKRVASSDQSKKKRRPRKRIISNKKNSKVGSQNPPESKEEIDKKNKEIQDKIKSTLAKLSGTKDSETKRSKYRKEKRSQHAEAIEEEKIKQEEDSKTLKVTEYISANDLAKLMDVTVNDVISKYLEIGMFVSINQRLDAETISIIAEEFGFKVEFTT